MNREPCARYVGALTLFPAFGKPHAIHCPAFMQDDVHPLRLKTPFETAFVRFMLPTLRLSYSAIVLGDSEEP